MGLPSERDTPASLIHSDELWGPGNGGGSDTYHSRAQPSAGFPSPFPPPGDLRCPDRLQLGEPEPRGKEAVDTARTEVGKEQAFVSGNNRGLGVVYGRSLSGPRLFTKGRISKSPTLLLLEKGTVLRENDLPKVTQPRRRGQTDQSMELFLGRATAQAMRVASESQSSQASHQCL